MKRIDSIIRPSKIEDVKEKLNNIGVTGMTVSQVLGYGMQKGHKQVYRVSTKSHAAVREQ